MQRWRFVVVKDAAVKATIGAYYKRAWDETVYPRYSAGTPAPGTSPERFRRMLAAAQYLADHIHVAPVWIAPCMEGANRLGATLTTLYLNFEKEVEAAPGMPTNVHSYALLPIGYPMARSGASR